MADTVKLPGVGAVKKQYAVGGVLVLAAVLAVAYYRHSKNASAATTAAAAQPDPNAIDPNTGLTYAEEAAGIQAGDLAGAGTPFGDTSGIIGYDAQGNPVYADQVGYGPAPSFTTNGNWAQAAEQYLVQTTGADAGTVAAALGTYIAGQPLTAAQVTVVQSAIAFFGPPPQAGSNGFPPALRRVAPAPVPVPPGGGGLQGGNPPTGHPVPTGPPPPHPGGPPANPGAVTGFSVTGHKGFADFGWAKNPRADNYNLVITGPQNVNRQTGNHNHQEGVKLRAGRYHAKVRANNHGTFGPFTAERPFTVT